MNPWFADTSYFLALGSRTDQWHGAAKAITPRVRGRRMITTAWIVTEVGNALSHPTTRGAFLKLLDQLNDENVEIVPPSEELFARGIELYADRPDKGWSLTDCISFVVMADEGVAEALTGDHHFTQAGFVALLK
jgi:predicted nucleic acid-binding protein